MRVHCDLLCGVLYCDCLLSYLFGGMLLLRAYVIVCFVCGLLCETVGYGVYCVRCVFLCVVVCVSGCAFVCDLLCDGVWCVFCVCSMLFGVG